MEKKLMSIILEDGSVDQVEILVSFEFNDNKKVYVVYTKMKQMRMVILLFMFLQLLETVIHQN